jgi:hypothetical protein
MIGGCMIGTLFYTSVPPLISSADTAQYVRLRPLCNTSPAVRSKAVEVLTQQVRCDGALWTTYGPPMDPL